MIPYLGCEKAREMLEAFADGELGMPDQILVESHLRWCQTCSARLADVRLIGESIRDGSYGANAHGDCEGAGVEAIHPGVWSRIGAEHDQSFAVRIAELFVDRRLLWPFVGATAAVMLCLVVAFSVLQAASEEQPESLAAMIGSLSNPGSDHNPLRLDNAMSIPRVLDNGIVLDGFGEGESVFALATVVNREGRIANYELLDSMEAGVARRASSRVDLMAELQEAMKQSRFAPAQAPGGRVVAVNLVWVIAHTTVKASLPLDLDPPSAAHRPSPAIPVKPAIVVPDEVPEKRGSASTLGSTTA